MAMTEVFEFECEETNSVCTETVAICPPNRPGRARNDHAAAVLSLQSAETIDTESEDGEDVMSTIAVWLTPDECRDVANRLLQLANLKEQG